jgi:hypothetical protein
VKWGIVCMLECIYSRFYVYKLNYVWTDNELVFVMKIKYQIRNCYLYIIKVHFRHATRSFKYEPAINHIRA